MKRKRTSFGEKAIAFDDFSSHHRLSARYAAMSVSLGVLSFLWSSWNQLHWKWNQPPIGSSEYCRTVVDSDCLLCTLNASCDAFKVDIHFLLPSGSFLEILIVGWFCYPSSNMKKPSGTSRWEEKSVKCWALTWCAMGRGRFQRVRERESPKLMNADLVRTEGKDESV